MCWPIKSIHTLFQKLSGSHKALVEMQDDVSELLRSATGEYKQTKVCFNTLFTIYTTIHCGCYHKHPPTWRPQAVLYHCAIYEDKMSPWMGPHERPAEKWSAPVHIKICWRPTWDHYVHLAAWGFYWALSIQHCGIVWCWSLHCVDRGTNESWHWELREAYFTSHTRAEKCAEVVEMFISGNQTVFWGFFSAGVLMRAGER